MVNKGCACCSDLSLAHLDCLVEDARTHGSEGNHTRWWQCPICDENWTGPAFVQLANLWWEVVENRAGTDAKYDREWLSCKQNLAESLSVIGKHKEAVTIILEVLTVKGEMYGFQHPDTLETKRFLGILRTKMGEHHVAEILLREVLFVQQSVLGAEHTETLTTESRLATSLHMQAKYQDAEEIVREVLKVQERVLGVEHKDTLTNRITLANSLWKRGKHTKAEEIMRDVLQVQTRVLGPEHPNTLSTTKNLNTLLCSQQVRQHRSGRCFNKP